MCQYSAVDGTPGDWHLIHLGHLALSGAGLMILEATAVSAEGRITAGDLGLYDDANEAGLAHVLTAIRAQSPIAVAMQVAHAGRKGSAGAGAALASETGEPTAGRRSASCGGMPRREPPPRSTRPARTVRATFSATAQRAARLFPRLEIHAGLLPLHSSCRRSRTAHRSLGGPAGAPDRFPARGFDRVRAVFPADSGWSSFRRRWGRTVGSEALSRCPPRRHAAARRST